MKMGEEMRCRFCGERLRDGDVCYGCYEHDRDVAYREGYDEGYKKGLEDGIQQGRNALKYEIESDIYMPEEAKRRLRWMY
jgi:hypothetical protein